MRRKFRSVEADVEGDGIALGSVADGLVTIRWTRLHACTVTIRQRKPAGAL